MNYNYFQENKKHNKILKILLQNENPDLINKKLKKKICKFNEFQHFNLFLGVCLKTTFIPFEKEVFSHFTKTLKKTDNEVDLYFPRSNINTSDPNEDNFVVFDSKKDLSKLTFLYLYTKEYPKETIISKLLVLKENIIDKFIQPLTIIIPTFKYRLQKSDDLFREKNNYLENLILELIDIEENCQNHIREIDNKINSFSIIKKGNYLIDIKDDELKQLYKNLEKYNFIYIDKTSLNQFLDVLKLDWEKHNSTIYLKMDNIQFMLFIALIKDIFNNKILLTNIEYAGNIHSKNGRIKANAVYSSKSKSTMNPKKFDEIELVFKNIKKD